MRVIALLGKLSGRGASREGIIRGIRAIRGIKGDEGEFGDLPEQRGRIGVGSLPRERVSGKAALKHAHLHNG